MCVGGKAHVPSLAVPAGAAPAAEEGVALLTLQVWRYCMSGGGAGVHLLLLGQ